MNSRLYNPLEPFDFHKDVCFLTGEKLSEPDLFHVSVLPEWLMDRYEMKEKYILMLNHNNVKYKDLLLPVSRKAKEAIDQLDKTTQEAFESGYEAVKALPEMVLFQWMARAFYGALYNDMAYIIPRKAARGEEFRLSPLLTQKFRNLHFMLQSLVIPVRFDGFTPWSVSIHQVKYSKDILNYKDETHKLNFCLAMNGFGIIACLQDNHAIAHFQKNILAKVGETILHPVQFEELYARFIYTNYIMRDDPDYKITEENGEVVFHQQKLDETARPKFLEWEDKVYAQTLANLLQPWGFKTEDVYTFPNAPTSFLIDEERETFIQPETITLPF